MPNVIAAMERFSRATNPCRSKRDNVLLGVVVGVGEGSGGEGSGGGSSGGGGSGGGSEVGGGRGRVRCR